MAPVLLATPRVLNELETHTESGFLAHNGSVCRTQPPHGKEPRRRPDTHQTYTTKPGHHEAIRRWHPYGKASPARPSGPLLSWRRQASISTPPFSGTFRFFPPPARTRISELWRRAGHCVDKGSELSYPRRTESTRKFRLDAAHARAVSGDRSYRE